MTEPPAPRSTDAIIGRYSGLARTALAGGTITDCDPGEFADGRFGAAAYPAAEGVPEAALRASLGCGNPLAVAGLRPGEIVAAVDVVQSTVSAHLKVLAEVRFLLFEHRGPATYYRINDACVDCFPTAADIVMGRPVPAQLGSVPAAQPQGARQ